MPSVIVNTVHRGQRPSISCTGSRAIQPGLARRGVQTALPAAASIGKSAPRYIARPHRQHSVLCRADVNWDAFRSSVELGSLSPPQSHTHNPGTVKQYDFIVIGSGIAGLTYALKMAAYGSVAVVTKDHANEGCTQYAQGGVCAVLDHTDSVQDHIRDTIVAGAYLNDPMAVEVVCREGPARVLELVALGAQFTRNKDGSLHLTKEGGHSNRRIVHAADLTGAEIERALLTAARSQKNIHFYEHHLATELVVDEVEGVRYCLGVDVLDQRTMSMSRFIGLSTMLACGGAGQVYPNTTNPHVATGDGIAMAYRAGAVVSNMEFIQFHPTALYMPNANPNERTFLITEAVRGEGGILYNLSGERFMEKYDERLELAPRDVVARSIHDQLRQRSDTHVLLDISHKPADAVLSHFPNIAAKCAEMGIDITQDPIPVVPAQHYTCGGVHTGLDGQTTIKGLYACGEVANSGLHGANRLASNSLLEGLVFADRAVNPSVAHAEHVIRHCGRNLHYAAASANFSGAQGARRLTPSLMKWVRNRRDELRGLMWRNCGIVRRTSELQEARAFASSLHVEAKAVVANAGVSTEAVELLNLTTVAEIVAACALQRKESRGGHYVLDYPQLDERECKPSTVQVAPAKVRTPTAPVPASAMPVGGAASGNSAGHARIQAPLPASVVITPKKKAVQRDMAVRSLPQDSA
uniref:L-aspartate oxidase n=1 Tax=Chlamydomonas chlamydogama TaxID=225041 RepID=A0A7S2VU96_9CHLO|mmetsp:Transcript_112/g.211  ORF Transcript_112/g.211 Transcript_112/m.211 type:complete len:695 (+) Transcript_112:333-2417(+)|eukprot:CAMPEP_0202894002 /NCGR_PEP_ID=MMETSP1392-20130828/3471_1 /ASSEMBLY_ACC=CAM_ASM_000868 /TAXON_ID=225041 /ORGANISM="Chlamydomonas chlamydogama, Strain SAG 11-48b" /LENGTH=694 /DNA_ID=CAMNT_0049578531 /DNA_START=299 /DNA_END=2383 /DNA_ORIENTATION=-